MFEDQLRNIEIGAILVTSMFFDKFNDLKGRAMDHVSYFQKLRRLALTDCVDRKCAGDPRRKHEPQGFFLGRYEMQLCEIIRVPTLVRWIGASLPHVEYGETLSVW